MLVVWSALLGVLVFMGIVIVTLMFGAAANRAEKKALLKTQAERLAGLKDYVADPPRSSVNERYIEA